MRPELRVVVGRHGETEFDAIIADVVLSSGLRHERSASWLTGTSLVALEAQQSGWTLLATQTDDEATVSAATTVARDAAGNLVVATWAHDRVTCRVFAMTATGAAAVLESLRHVFPETADRSEHLARVTFWNSTGDGAQRITRRITVPAWSAIRKNYHSSTRAGMDTLIARLPDVASGKLILWHGPAGTGKTWALRALLREWRSWANGHYILDPERFFGQSATYMMSVLLDKDRRLREHDSRATEDMWRLLIVEDAGELLGKDARVQAGQGLARLLNVCDGLVGQGLKVLVLLTTNEEVGTMHPAVIRRGRCVANIRFELLTALEARQWSLARGREAVVEKSAPIADLFAADQIATVGVPNPPGFRIEGRRHQA